MRRLMLLSLCLCFAATGLLSEVLAESRHVLKGRIIRALAVEPGNPDHILVGQKAGKPGSGLVFKSLDGGKTWRTQNANAPMSPAATDVQGVAALSGSVLLAGTWKHGLFASSDGGRRFRPVTGFPSKDVRDFAIAGARVYAASATKGVFESRDGGTSWNSISPAHPFLWSLTAAGDALYASSPEAGVFARNDGAWQHIFDRDKIYAAAASEEKPQHLALAGETGLYLGQGGKWRKVADGEKFADVLIAPSGQIIAGSWQNGLVVLSPGGTPHKRLLTGKAVIHVKIARPNLLAGTWGDGLHIIPLADLAQ